MEHVLTICDLKENNLYIQFQNFKKNSPRKLKIVSPISKLRTGKNRSEKMTEFGKDRIRSIIKVGYFISILKFLHLGCHMEPYLS